MCIHNLFTKENISNINAWNYILPNDTMTVLCFLNLRLIYSSKHHGLKMGLYDTLVIVSNQNILLYTFNKLMFVINGLPN